MPKRNGAGIELLADPTRRRLVAAIALRPRRPSSLALELGLSRPAITRQLHLMRDAGLIRSSRLIADRRGYLFSIDPQTHGQITAWLSGTEIGRPATTPGDAPDPEARQFDTVASPSTSIAPADRDQRLPIHDRFV